VSAPGSASVELVPRPSDEVRALIEELDRTLAADYPPEQRHGLNFDAIFAPNIRFFMARLDGVAAGCGGVALFDDFAEVKRMYVREQLRGGGIADALLSRIERETRDAGLTVLRLETGDSLAAALRFYGRSGFTPCAAFGDYRTKTPASIARSVFLEKRLTT
jgi:putative acetyltransferase